MTSSHPPIAELQAPAHWQVIDFISDLHLQAAEPRTAAAWESYLAHTPAQALFILGDLFEVWVGDDALDATDDEARFERTCLAALHAASARLTVHVMHGNRDFLLGAEAARRGAFRLIDDPTMLALGQERWLLSHGDALCLDDRDYQEFRAQVRSAPWQQTFLSRPLSERRAIARGLREHSEQRKGSGMPYADVDTALARQWLQTASAHAMIHGHTHHPADHELGTGLRRHVLSDWHAGNHALRADVLRLRRPPQTDAWQLQRLRPELAV